MSGFAYHISVVGVVCILLVFSGYLVVRAWTGRAPSITKLSVLFGGCFLVGIVPRLAFPTTWCFILGNILWPMAVFSILLHGIIVATDRYMLYKYGSGIVVARRFLSIILVYAVLSIVSFLLARFASQGVVEYVNHLVGYSTQCGLVLLVLLVIWTGRCKEQDVQDDLHDINVVE